MKPIKTNSLVGNLASHAGGYFNRFWRTASFAGLLLVAGGRAANAGPAATNSVADLSLEDLINVKVTSVSKQEENLNDAAAAIFVLSNDGLRRSGATTVADSLRRNVEHIKEIVAMQQSYATFGGVKEMINVVDLIEDSLRMNEGALSRHRVEIVREFESVPPLNVEKHKILQILVNLLRNAKHACQDSDGADKRLTVRVANGAGRIKISVIDNGVGIPLENLTRIFNHGFTTRKDGHGFGLHSGALAAKEMGGSLTVHSDGSGQGATFTLELPLEQDSSPKLNAA